MVREERRFIQQKFDRKCLSVRQQPLVVLHGQSGGIEQLLGLAKWMLVHSTTDRPEFGKALLRQQITFYCAVYALRFRVAFYPLGWPGVDARKLVDTLASLRDSIQQLALQRVEA